MITAYIDFKSLDCFLAISPILKLAADCETPVSWQPYRSKSAHFPRRSLANQSPRLTIVSDENPSVAYSGTMPSYAD